MKKKVEIYIDGSSRGNPGPGGIGIHIKAGKEEFRIS
ncbi:MAG TPA: ribonuclease HI, partial [bacterium (Candidatus Stahlbacteria)]|nr:ribonuclease HI [Candidatus Stahlbacteria bacterium]